MAARPAGSWARRWSRAGGHRFGTLPFRHSYVQPLASLQYRWVSRRGCGRYGLAAGPRPCTPAQGRIRQRGWGAAAAGSADHFAGPPGTAGFRAAAAGPPPPLPAEAAAERQRSDDLVRPALATPSPPPVADASGRLLVVAGFLVILGVAMYCGMRPSRWAQRENEMELQSLLGLVPADPDSPGFRPRPRPSVTGHASDQDDAADPEEGRVGGSDRTGSYMRYMRSRQPTPADSTADVSVSTEGHKYGSLAKHGRFMGEQPPPPPQRPGSVPTLRYIPGPDSPRTLPRHPPSTAPAAQHPAKPPAPSHKLAQSSYGNIMTASTAQTPLSLRQPPQPDPLEDDDDEWPILNHSDHQGSRDRRGSALGV